MGWRKFLFLFHCVGLLANTAVPGRLIIKHFEADDIGVSGGYSTVEGMMAAPIRYRHIPYADIRFHAFNRGLSALNGGLGYRYNIAGSGAIVGINGYYDARWTTGQTFSQFGGGFEFLSRFLDMRFNGYLPVKSSQEIRSNTFEAFVGNNIIIEQKKRVALTGGDGELGFYFARLGDLKMYLAGGSYYFKRQQCSTKWGAKGRLRFSWLDNIWAEFSVKHDSFFGLNYQGRAALQLPFWKKPRTRVWSYFPNMEALLIQPPVRQEIIALCDVFNLIPARDKNGDIITVYFVDNTSSSEGTFESPFPTLAQAQAASAPGNIIYVYPGDGTTTGMDAGITLQDQQLFLGSGTAHDFDLAIGTITIPATTATNPTITNLAGNAVRLGANNLVRGFTITAPTARGFSGTNTQTTVIDQIICNGAMGSGVNLTTSGSGTCNLSLTNSTFSGGAADGVAMSGSGSSSTTATMSSLTINNNSINGITFTNTGNATSTITAMSNTLQGNSMDGVNIAGGGKSLTATVNSNTIRSSGAQGIDIFSSGSALVTTTVKDNNINTAVIGIDYSTSGTSQLTANVDNNTVTKTSTASIFFDGSSGGTATVTATNNTIVSTTGGVGLEVSSGSSGTMSATLNSNTLKSITGTGIKLLASASGTITCNADNNSVTNATSRGLYVTGSGSGATVNGTFSTNTFDTTTSNCILINGSDTRTYTLSFTGNTLNMSSTTNLLATIDDSTTLSLTLDNNTITNSANRGVNIVANDMTNLTLNATNNTITDSSSFAFQCQSFQTIATATNSITVGSNTFNDNSNRGLLLQTDNAAVATMNVTNNNMSNNTSPTELKTDTTSALCATFTGNSDTAGFLINEVVGTSTLSIVGDQSGLESSNTGTFSYSPSVGDIDFVTSCP